MLGTTFSFVFLDFAQRMQDGDRFYYLFRMPPGSSIGEQIISTKFSDIIARNAATNDLNGDAFAYGDRYFNPDPAMADGGQQHFTGSGNGDYYFSAYTALLDDMDPTSIAAGGHIVISGGAGHDHLIAGDGDDTVHGGAGNDYIQGSQGNDHLFGGPGDDFIIDDENDDFIRGGEGDDTVIAGKGALDTVFGEEGNDELHGGDGIDELFGGPGDDAIFGDGDTDVMIGDTGNDFMDGGDSVDEMWGGDGNDIMFGGVGDDHLNGDGGSDLLFGGLGAAANDGDRYLGDQLPNQFGVFPIQEGGFGTDGPGIDIASYEFVNIAITADLQSSNENGTGSNLIDTYAFIDGLVGSEFDDDLTGAGEDTTTSNGFENILVGGAGNDLLTGLGGDDYIAGDWVVVNNDLSVAASQDKTAAIVDSHGLNRIDTGDPVPLGGNPESHLGHVLGDNGVEGTEDTAVFSGRRSDYEIMLNADGTIQIVDLRGIDSTAVGDTLKDIEFVIFQGDGPTPVATADLVSPPNVINGTPGNDRGPNSLIGDGNDNIINGLAGHDRLLGLGGDDQLNGGTGNDVLRGGPGNDELNGGPGNDRSFGGSGDDTFNWTVGGGRDIINGGGGNNNPGVDTVNIFGDANEERFDIYTNEFAVEELDYDGDAEIVIARNGAIIAELTRIEEIFVDGMGGGDEFDIRGDFGDTALETNTITIEGTDGDDTLNISGLESEHRVVFRSNGGTDTIIGDLRPQDVVETGPDQTLVDNGDGTSSVMPLEANDPGNAPPPSGSVQTVAGADGASLLGGAGNDTLAGGDGNDNLVGNGGNDILLGNGGNDTALGGDGDDIILTDGGMDHVLAGAGNDWIDAGADRDVVNAGDGDDTIAAGIGDGDDVYRGDGGTDTLDMAALTADATVDLKLGSASSAESGNDTLDGIENATTGAGNDTLIANDQANVLTGGIGNDTFVFGSVADANGDEITDVSPGDKIDLSGIAHEAGLGCEMAFDLLDSGMTFTEAGQLIIRHEADGVYLDGNVDGDSDAEFSIKFGGNTDLNQDDFV